MPERPATGAQDVGTDDRETRVSETDVPGQPVAALDSPPGTAPRHPLLEGLEARGARAFDAVGTERVARLLVRAREVGGRASVLLEERAALHATRLASAQQSACDRARASLTELEARGVVRGAVADGLRDRLEQGDPVPVLQALRRLRDAPARAAATGTDPSVSAHRYRAALADLETSLCAERTPTPDDHAGLLDGRALAARVLEEAERVSPAWRRSLVASLLDLASLLHFDEPPPPKRAR